MYDELCKQDLESLPLPKGWTDNVRHAVLTARRFFVSDDTIRAWLRRADDDSLLRTRMPVNRFPDFVRYAVQRIKLFCPALGKVKIADKLARAGVHIGKTTVQRILKEKPAEEPEPSSNDTGKCRRIVAKYPSHMRCTTAKVQYPSSLAGRRSILTSRAKLSGPEHLRTLKRVFWEGQALSLFFSRQSSECPNCKRLATISF